MLTIEGDRRIHSRLPLAQPCKIHDSHSGKYIAATTRDISMGGALIEVSRLVSLKPGDTLHLGVAMKRRQGLLRCNEMMKAQVTRSVQTVDDRTLLGLQFESQLEAAEPGDITLRAAA